MGGHSVSGIQIGGWLVGWSGGWVGGLVSPSLEAACERAEMKWCEGDVVKAPVGQISQPPESPALPSCTGNLAASASSGPSMCMRARVHARASK